MSAAAVELVGLHKAFGPVIANADIHLRVQAGTVHGVIGENGAGKSTAMKMLYGIYAPDGGEIRVEGTSRRWSSPRDAIAAGVGMVHQHFMLAGPYTALDNVLLGAEGSASFGPIPRARARARLEEISRQYGLPVDWDAPIERLPVGIQQRIEILKLLFRDARILILDEPTAVLTPNETLELFTQLRKLTAEGRTVLVITHKLKEVIAHTDRVTVFQAGRVTGERKTSETSIQELAELMVGRKVNLQLQVPPQPALGEALLEVRGLGLPGKLKDLSFRVRGGEVVGVAGVEGNGQSELLQALLHPSEPDCRSSGEVRVLDQDVSALPTAEIKRLGVGLIPEDRHKEGLLMERPLDENYLLGRHRIAAFSRGGFLRSREVRLATARALEEYDVRPRRPEIQAGRLSGGNQQKLIIARELGTRELGGEPKVLIAAQPTRGVDVGAIELIHRRILDARSRGVAVLLVSSELDEILALSDRILVMYEGGINGEFARGQADERAIGLRMGGAVAG